MFKKIKFAALGLVAASAMLPVAPVNAALSKTTQETATEILADTPGEQLIAGRRYRRRHRRVRIYRRRPRRRHRRVRIYRRRPRRRYRRVYRRPVRVYRRRTCYYKRNRRVCRYRTYRRY
ncbi:MAG: hypothetical protein SWZ49_16850 [Cyanobacteriota bacterium]|nr:hypothetical protein [Cyanobacteriota bacterium]